MNNPRKKIVIANWKMHTTVTEAVNLADAIKKGLKSIKNLNLDIVLCPPFISIYPLKEALSKSKIGLGAQNIFYQEKGAFTGEVSVLMLKGLCRYVILGHSERRQNFGETDEEVAKKARLSLKHGIFPVICVGETLFQRESEQGAKAVINQVQETIKDVTSLSAQKLIFAYEPVWAISTSGTGMIATPEDADQMIILIRKILAGKFTSKVAEKIRILYGGSVDGDNVASFTSQPGVDGVLVGGASIRGGEFLKIIREVSKC